MRAIEQHLTDSNNQNFKPSDDILFVLVLTRNICLNKIASYEDMVSLKDIIDTYVVNFRGTA